MSIPGLHKARKRPKDAQEAGKTRVEKDNGEVGGQGRGGGGLAWALGSRALVTLLMARDDEYGWVPCQKGKA